MWLICGILTWTDTLPEDPSEWGHGARVDVKSQVLSDAKWFRFPYPCECQVNKLTHLIIICMSLTVDYK